MPNRDAKKIRARKIVADRFRRFVATLMRQFTKGADELWRQVQARQASSEGKPDQPGSVDAR